MKFLLIIALAGTVTFCGCAFHPANAFHAAFGQASSNADSGVNGSKTPPPSTIKQTVQRQVAGFWVAGILCLLAAGALAYFQNYFMAIKFGLAGLVLPIFATWYSAHYGIIIAAVLIGIALVAYLHFKVVLNPLAKELLTKAKERFAPPGA